MKFTCPKCSTRYNVADDKVPPNRTLRFTCKKCSNVIRIRRKPDAGAKGATESTQIASLSEINDMKKRSKDSAGPTPFIPPPPPTQDEEWYILIAGKQKGPLTIEDIGGMLDAREIDKRTYAWRDGMGDWLRLGAVPEFADLAAGAGDATWRVVKPVSPQDGDPDEGREQTTPVKRRHSDISTKTMDPEQLMAALANATPEPNTAELALRVANAVQATAESSTDGQDLALVAALAGQPTGDSLSRDAVTGEMGGAQLEDFAPFGGEGVDGIGGVSNESAGAASGFASVPFPAPSDPGYLQAPPGEATKVFMATAGIYRRRRRNKLAAIAAALAVAMLAAVVVMDISGVIELPGMGNVYAGVGLEDPNVDRAVARVDEELTEEDLSEAERSELESKRKKLRQRLLGLDKKKPGAAKAKVASIREAPTVGIEDKRSVNKADRALAASIFGDRRKQERKVNLTPPEEIRAPNLPDGLTQEAIFEVISENNRSMSLCISQSMKAGEKLTGKMEVELTIVATGGVRAAKISTPAFRSSTIGNCTVKTVKRWKFPRFNGEPVTVIFPYVLSAGF